jgi:hypothetical protein
MNSQKENFWRYIEDHLGLFLISIRFNLDNKIIKIANDKASIYKLFKLFCIPPSEKYINATSLQDFVDNDKDLKRLIELDTIKLTNPDKSLKIPAVWDYINQFEGTELYIGTPFELIEEIIDRIPEEYLLGNILDPACGRGRFLRVIKNRLLKAGFENKEIIGHLYGIDNDIKSAYLTAGLIDPLWVCDKTNIYLADTLKNFPKELIDMKFDIVVGNPPFQTPKKMEGDKNSGTIGGDLWSKFVIKSLGMCKEKGMISLIHPSMWRKPDHVIWKALTNNQMEYLEIHSDKDGQQVFDCSTRYDWYVVKKEPCSKETIVVDEEGKKHSIDLSKLLFLPNYMYEDFTKMISNDPTKCCIVLYSASIYETRKTWMNEKNIKEFKYPCVHSMTKDGFSCWFSSEKKDFFGVPKVILGWGRYLYPLLDTEGIYGMTQNAFAISIKSEKEGKLIVQAINSDKFKEIIKASKWGAFQTDWRMFKYFKKDFWKEFLSEEEIKLIEESVK